MRVRSGSSSCPATSRRASPSTRAGRSRCCTWTSTSTSRTGDCLEFFEPKVAPGGVVAFDEYRSGQWHGATRAIEEYYRGPPPGIRRSPNWNRWFLVKS